MQSFVVFYTFSIEVTTPIYVTIARNLHTLLCEYYGKECFTIKCERHMAYIALYVDVSEHLCKVDGKSKVKVRFSIPIDTTTMVIDGLTQINVRMVDASGELLKGKSRNEETKKMGEYLRKSGVRVSSTRKGEYIIPHELPNRVYFASMSVSE